jgi:hypothetical protein
MCACPFCPLLPDLNRKIDDHDQQRQPAITSLWDEQNAALTNGRSPTQTGLMNLAMAMAPLSSDS